MLGIVEAARGERKHVVTTAIEHPAVLSTGKALEKRGVSVTYVRVGASGVIDPADVASALRPGMAARPRRQDQD
jgi:cysteine desulfurase